MSKSNETFDVVVIGAGPSGAVASALLNKKPSRLDTLVELCRGR